MADIQYGDTVAGQVPAAGVNVAALANWLGAVVSVALIAGLGWWGYQLMVRDVTGVPVVRALEGPMRVAPDDPGGASASYQGLAVNKIPAVGQAQAPADRLVLAPKPTVLRSEDQTAAELGQVAAASTPVVSEQPRAAESQAAVEEVVAVSAPVSVPVPLTPLQDQAALIEATLRLVEGVDQGEVIAASVAGVARSLRPVGRPGQGLLVPASLTLAPEVPEVGAVQSVAPRDIPVGTRLAQLGAFETIEIAQAEWLKISSRFEDFMADKSRVIQKAQSGGKEFYRLRAYGFDDLSDARRFCSALLAAQANCIPVVTR